MDQLSFVPSSIATRCPAGTKQNTLHAAASAAQAHEQQNVKHLKVLCRSANARGHSSFPLPLSTLPSPMPTACAVSCTTKRMQTHHTTRPNGNVCPSHAPMLAPQPPRLACSPTAVSPSCVFPSAWPGHPQKHPSHETALHCAQENVSALDVACAHSSITSRHKSTLLTSPHRMTIL